MQVGSVEMWERSGDLPFLILLILLPSLFLSALCCWYFCEMKTKQRAVSKLKCPYQNAPPEGAVENLNAQKNSVFFCSLVNLAWLRTQMWLIPPHICWPLILKLVIYSFISSKGQFSRCSRGAVDGPAWFRPTPGKDSCVSTTTLTFDYCDWPANWQFSLSKEARLPVETSRTKTCRAGANLGY